MQARIEKRGMHHVFRSRQPFRKPHFGKRLPFAEVQFPDAAKTGSVFKPELLQPDVEIGGRECLLATVPDLLHRKGRAGRPL